ncbi:karyogamy protein KAR4 [Scheffersomyces coipomensis]|uniref:karyogamy protein KAR4 n=1 Tax=Scheffersomyces coipomensis TaxID=1788519 RepID=UPI00315C8664
MLPNKYTYNKFGTRAPNSSSSSSSSSDRLMMSKRSSSDSKSKSHNAMEMDYCNHILHSNKNKKVRPTNKRNEELGIQYIRNINNPFEGYPKLNKLHQLKRSQMVKHAVKPYGVRVPTNNIVPTLYNWIENYNLKFDVIMIGALVENQFILPILNNIPFHRLCSKPGFLFIWATTQKIQELTNLLNNDTFNKKFRRSEELIFLPIEKDSPYFPGDDGDESIPLFERQQWHCWMCITGTVRRATDNHLIHCNIDTDLQIESFSPNSTSSKRNVVPDALYRVAENFSNSNRRLHIIPSRTGYDLPIRLRLGWVIMSPDVMINNFNPQQYKEELYAKSLIQYKSTTSSSSNITIPGTVNNQNNNNIQYLVPQTDEIEDLRPKSPVIASKSG